VLGGDDVVARIISPQRVQHNGVGRRETDDCSDNARARTEAQNSGFTKAPHYDGDFTPSRRAAKAGGDSRSGISSLASHSKLSSRLHSM